ncbi:MAG: PQQ-binding-like beta-propeller repeat protein [Candidatus Hydrogenedentes bacterium]|nr:PQQ-binding-like beta-propeller repeat protein [Candidatus Hydrogenedentota bacterium]
MMSLCAHLAAAGAGAGKEWTYYLGDLSRTHYSRLDQINAKNVEQLQVAWTFRSGGEQQIQCNPIVVDGLLYGVSAERHVFALNAATGEEVWRFVPPDKQAMSGVCRGVQYWASGRDKRIMASMGHSIYALAAKTGKPVPSFGVGGIVDIKKAYDREIGELHVGSTSPGVIYKDTIIVCTRVNEAKPAAPGDILAFDVRTGARKWIFHTIPHPGEFGHETWPPEAWKMAGGANCWAGMSLDEERGIVYIPTGSAAYDFYGPDRKGDNLFANCLLALDAETGKRLWHYQVIRHDLWDRDLPAPPNLVTLNLDGKERDAVAQITKSGHVFVFDRVTGEPLFPIDEVEAPASDIPGEWAAPAQALPLKPPPFARQHFTEDLVTDRAPEARAFVLERLRRARSGPAFVPPSFEGTVIFPGFDGGGEWGGAAVDPETDLLYVNASEMPWLLTMYDVTEGAGGLMQAVGARTYAQNCVFCHGIDLKGDPLREFPPIQDLRAKFSIDQMCALVRDGRNRMPSFAFLMQEEIEAVVQYICGLEAAARETGSATPVATPLPVERWFNHTGYNRFVDQDGYPAVKPPWGTLSAIDLNGGEITWQVTLGESPELAAAGYRNTGAENYGGPIVTAGGLIFIAATKDEMFRAFDKETGALLWETKLPAAGYATPCTYMIRGRQYVVIAAAGGKIGSPAGDAYVAFALPAAK